MRVLDIAAGNGVSGEALAAAGLHPVLGTDIVPSARAAALRDRPGLYDQYLTLDLLALTDGERATVAALHANALSCVAPVGEADGSSCRPTALAGRGAACSRPTRSSSTCTTRTRASRRVTAEAWAAGVGRTEAQELERRRYLHRYTVNGAPFEMDGVVWRLRRAR